MIATIRAKDAFSSCPPSSCAVLGLPSLAKEQLERLSWLSLRPARRFFSEKASTDVPEGTPPHACGITPFLVSDPASVYGATLFLSARGFGASVSREALERPSPGIENLGSSRRWDIKAESTSSTSPAIPVITETPEVSSMVCKVWLIAPQINVVTPALWSMEIRSDEERSCRRRWLLPASRPWSMQMTATRTQESKTGATRDRNTGMASAAT